MNILFGFAATNFFHAANIIGTKIFYGDDVGGESDGNSADITGTEIFHVGDEIGEIGGGGVGGESGGNSADIIATEVFHVGDEINEIGGGGGGGESDGNSADIIGTEIFHVGDEISEIGDGGISGESGGNSADTFAKSDNFAEFAGNPPLIPGIPAEFAIFAVFAVAVIFPAIRVFSRVLAAFGGFRRKLCTIFAASFRDMAFIRRVYFRMLIYRRKVLFLLKYHYFGEILSKPHLTPLRVSGGGISPILCTTLSTDSVRNPNRAL